MFVCCCGNALGPKGFKMTRRPCLCVNPMPPVREPLGTLGVIMRGEGYRDPRRKALGLQDVSQDGGGALKGTFWGE